MYSSTCYVFLGLRQNSGILRYTQKPLLSPILAEYSFSPLKSMRIIRAVDPESERNRSISF
jgi:hypothetical protein